MTTSQKYNPQWKNRYQSLSAQFEPLINDLVEGIYHAGSTSVEGMLSENMIDIDVVVEDFGKIEQIKAQLSRIGYINESDIDDEVIHFRHNKTVPHQLRLMRKDSVMFKCRQLLQKHLQENPTALNELNTLKQKLISNKMNPQKYQKAKDALIRAYLQEQGVEPDELDGFVKFSFS